MTRPQLLVFDVNETLSDLAPMAQRSPTSAPPVSWRRCGSRARCATASRSAWWAGIRLVTLSNGAVGVAERLLTDAGVRDRFERLLSVAEAPAWKPADVACRYALSTCGVGASDAMLVAVHQCDLDGAARAGLRTAWIDRGAAPYPRSFSEPEVRATDLVDLARQLA